MCQEHCEKGRGVGGACSLHWGFAEALCRRCCPHPRGTPVPHQELQRLEPASEAVPGTQGTGAETPPVQPLPGGHSAHTNALEPTAMAWRPAEQPLLYAQLRPAQAEMPAAARLPSEPETIEYARVSEGACVVSARPSAHSATPLTALKSPNRALSSARLMAAATPAAVCSAADSVPPGNGSAGQPCTWCEDHAGQSPYMLENSRQPFTRLACMFRSCTGTGLQSAEYCHLEAAATGTTFSSQPLSTSTMKRAKQTA